MDSLDYVTYLNNEGVWLLQQGDATSAIRSFERATQILRDCTDPTKLCSWPDYEATMIATCRTLCIRQSPTSMPNFSMDKFNLYNRPFRIERLLDHSLESCSPYDKHNISPSIRQAYHSFVDVLNAHILFNTALAWHHHAKTLGRDESHRKAGRQYQNLLQVACRNAYGGNDMAYSALSCLVINNLAVLHHDHCQYHESAACLRIVQALLQDLNGLTDYLYKHELTGMLWNTTNSQPSTVACAA